MLECKIKLKVYKNFKERNGGGMKSAGSFAIDGPHVVWFLGACGPRAYDFLGLRGGGDR